MDGHDTIIRGVRRISFKWGKVSFPDFFPGVQCFFPVENSHFGTPKTNFSGLKSEKQKKKEGPPPHFSTCPSIFNFPPFLSFFIFLLFCSSFPFFLASLFPVGQHKFPGQKYQGGTLSPAPPVMPLITMHASICPASYSLVRIFYRELETVLDFNPTWHERLDMLCPFSKWDKVKFWLSYGTTDYTM